MLNDCICRKCSVIATHERLALEAERLERLVSSDPQATISKKRKAKEARKLEAKLRASLDHGRLEEDVKGVKLDKVFSRASTKQAMIARVCSFSHSDSLRSLTLGKPPPVLALHLNRSLSYGQFAMKNSIRIIFPEILDLTPFMTSGSLSTVPSVPISVPPPSLPRSTTPTQAMYSTSRTIYRLAAVVCHYGQHSFGHYVCFRRKPRPSSCGATRFAPPRLVHPLGCECEKCVRYGNIRDDDDSVDSMYRPGRGWLRISDDSVKECGIETVLQEGSGAFMLYYERVVQSRPGIYPLHDSPRSSEETLKPNHSTVGVNRSTASLASRDEMERSVYGARIVRSVAAGKRRSASLAPSERNSSKDFLPHGNGSSASLILPNGNASHSSVTLKPNRQRIHGANSSTGTLKSSNLSVSAPDLRGHPSSALLLQPPSTPSHHHAITQSLQPSIVDPQASSMTQIISRQQA